MVQYSNERLIEALRECKEKYGKITTQNLNNDDDLPSGPIYSYRFNSFADAARRAGLSEEAKRLEENKKKRVGYSDDEIEDFLHDISDSNNQVSTRMIENNDGPSTATIRNHIDDNSIVGKVIDGVEIVSHRDYTKADKQTVDSTLTDIAEEKGTVRLSYLQNSDISRNDVYRYYDSIKDAREKLDIPKPDNKKTGFLQSVKQPHTYIYVIRRDGELYVGKSEQPLQRLRQHTSEAEVSLEKILRVPEDRDENDYEREIAMDTAREYDETNITGGR